MAYTKRKRNRLNPSYKEAKDANTAAPLLDLFILFPYSPPNHPQGQLFLAKAGSFIIRLFDDVIESEQF
ncbi:hypothetical protein SAMN05192559_101335 [Halobacillus karajensis]|nr:hypothetical protein SAMN05192559_101335 [Halobacillus karajensis]